MLHIEDGDIGGARVRRVFSLGGRHLMASDMMTADEVRAIPTANRRALTEQQYIEIWPSHESAAADMPRHIVSRGAGKYDVIAGVKLNEHLLSKDEAEALAG